MRPPVAFNPAQGSLPQLGAGAQGRSSSAHKSLNTCCPAGRWFGCPALCVDVDTLAAGKRHGVELLEELGRGMFGKVFRGARLGLLCGAQCSHATLALPQWTCYRERHFQHSWQRLQYFSCSSDLVQGHSSLAV